LALTAALLITAAPASAETTAEGRIERWFDQLAAESGSSRGLIPFHRLSEHQEYLDVAPRLDRTAERLSKRSGTDPLLAARLREWLGTRADRRGDADAAREHFMAVGYLPDWATIGPFPNYGGAAMDREVGPQSADCGDGCEEDGRVHAWIEREGFGSHGYLDLSSCFEERRDVLAFLRTYVYVPQATPVALRVGGGDGVEITVAGHAALQDLTRRSAAPDQQAIGVVLPAGWSELRIKLGQVSGPWGLYLRITAPDGRPLDDLRSLARPPADATMARGDGQTVEVYDPVAEALATTEYAPAAELAHAALLVSYSGVADRRDDEVARMLRRALQAGDSADLLLDLADETAEPEEQLQAIMRCLALDPDRSDAHLAHYHYLRQQANRRDDLEALRRAADDPTHLVALRTLASELSDIGAPEAGIALLQRAAATHPNATTLEVLQAQMWLDLGNRDRALECYGRSLVIADMASTRMRRMGLRRETGDQEGALDDARLLAERFPHGLRYQVSFARELSRAGQPEGSVDFLRDAVQRFSDAASLHRELGEILHELFRDDEAFEAWGTSLALRPRDPDLEQYMTYLEGGEDPLQARWRQEPRILPRHRGDPSVYDGAPARFLLLSRAIQVFPNGSDQEYVQNVIQIDSEVGGRAFETISMGYDRERERLRVLNAEVLHPDGSVSSARNIWDESGVSRSAGAYYQVYVKHVAFDELRPGDVVNVEYKRENREKRNRFNDFFGVMAPLQSWVPTVQSIVHVTVPDAMPLYTGGRGFVDGGATVHDDLHVHEFRAEDLPALPSETGGPGYYGIGAYLSATNFESWDQVASWWLDLAREQFRLGEDGERIVAELASGADDTEQIVRRIWEYVLHNTHYVGLEFGIHGWKPYESRDVLERGYGDCKDQAALLVSMLRATGVDAEMVLLQTVGNGQSETMPANLYMFNHAIAYVPALDRYLDPTAEYAPLESLRWDDQGAIALRIAGDGSSTLVEIPVSRPEDNLTTSDTVLHVAPSGTATFREHWTERGLQVADIRYSFHDDSTRLQDLELNYQGRLPGVRLTSLEVDGIDDQGNSLVIDVTGEIPAFARMDGDTLRVPVTLFPDELGQNRAPEGEAGRRTDVVLRVPHAAEVTTVIHPPSGMLVGDVPQPVELSCEHARYRQEVTVEEGAARVRIELVYTDRTIAVQDYPEFRRFCLAVDRAQDQTIVLERAQEAP